MEQTAEDEHISSIEGKLNSLIQRSSDMERRLGVLEYSSKTLESPLAKISHNYLNHIISKARRDYERGGWGNRGVKVVKHERVDKS